MIRMLLVVFLSSFFSYVNAGVNLFNKTEHPVMLHAVYKYPKEASKEQQKKWIKEDTFELDRHGRKEIDLFRKEGGFLLTKVQALETDRTLPGEPLAEIVDDETYLISLDNQESYVFKEGKTSKKPEEEIEVTSVAKTDITIFAGYPYPRAILAGTEQDLGDGKEKETTEDEEEMKTRIGEANKFTLEPGKSVTLKKSRTASWMSGEEQKSAEVVLKTFSFVDESAEYGGEKIEVGNNNITVIGKRKVVFTREGGEEKKKKKAA